MTKCAAQAHVPLKGERRALGYSEFASLAKRVHTTSGIYAHHVSELTSKLSTRASMVFSDFRYTQAEFKLFSIKVCAATQA